MKTGYNLIYVLVSILFGICTINTLGIGLIIGLDYLPKINHTISSECTVQDCTSFTTNCCSRYGKGTSCYTCQKNIISFQLVIENVTYSQTQEFQTGCISGNTPCYYDDRHIQSSLSLVKEIPMCVMGLICLSILQAILLTILAVLSLFIGSDTPIQK